MPRGVVVVLSTIFQIGGIQRFNRMLCLALDQLSSQLDLRVTVLSQDDTLEDYQRHGAPWKLVEFIPGNGPRRLSARTLAVCLRERPQLLLIGLLGMTPLGVACLPLLRGGFGFVAHGMECWNEPRLVRRWAARRARFVFAVSRHTAQTLERTTGIAPAALRLLPNTLEPGFERLDQELQPEVEGAPELLTVSRLMVGEENKGVDHALTAFSRLASRFPGARYRIVGGGSDKRRLVELAGALGLGERVVFQQDLSDAELARCYRRCSVFVLPSGQEGFGIVFLEAMRFAKPCVGGREGGTPEVIEDGRTGLLVPFGDVAALEAALARLLSDPSLCRRMGQAGRERLLQHFTFNRFRARLESHLRELLQL